jgi:hypothetical protein
VPYFNGDRSQVVVEGIFVVKKDRGRQIIKHSEAAQNALAPYVGGMPEIQPHQAFNDSNTLACDGGVRRSSRLNNKQHGKKLQLRTA